MSNSTISWLDFSESERRRTLEVISLFENKETRDELGLGSIRDGFANHLFPGTTTLLTRARYFLLVPWLYQSYEQKGMSSEKITERLRRDEINLIGTLKQSREKGIIGQRAGVNLQRFPSSIYWVGLQQWGICRFPGTQDQYHRSLNKLYEFPKRHWQTDEEQLSQEMGSNWDPNLPVSPEDFLKTAKLSLTAKEAGYLKDCLNLRCTGSLLAHLVENTKPVDENLVGLPWLHPQLKEFPIYLREKLEHARNFSETIYGAALLYNFLLSKKIEDDALSDSYLEDLKRWHDELSSRERTLKQWDQKSFWSLTKSINSIPLRTERFVNQWLGMLFENGKIAKPEKNKKMHALIEDRERDLKGSRSRFANQRHLEIWTGAASAGQIDYRWRVVRGIVNDILAGLKKNGRNKHAGTR